MVEQPLRVAVTLEQCWHAVPGGTATAALGPLPALRARPDLDVVGVSARHQAAPPPAWRPDVPVRMLPLPRPALYEAWHRLGRPAVERATGPVDVVHATGMAVPPRTAPLVVTVHDLAFVHEPGHATRRGLRFFHRAVALARSRADLVVVPSRATLDDCVAHGFDPGRLRLVPWGIDAPAAGPDEVARARARHGIAGPYVLWAGTVEPRKNLPVLLRAFALLVGAGGGGGPGRPDRDGLELVLAGPDGWGEGIDAWVAPVRSRVRRVGFVPAGELRALYAGAAAFCYPSSREGFGLPVLEAMAQGAPVVTSAGTATAEAAGGAGLVVDPSRPEAVAEALAAVLDDPALAARLAREGRARAAACSWRRTADGLAAVYHEVAGR